ncbi:MAG: PIN domain-containing protein [Chloroflexota bacterium]
MIDLPRRIYLDVSALCRPFDDQSQLRVRLESDAVLLILSQVQSKSCTLIVSPAHIVEIAAIEERAEREHLQSLLETNNAGFRFDLPAARKRAEELVRKGIGVADAAHLALAEQAECDFITCDDRLIRQCQRIIPEHWCGTPIAYCDKENLK